MIIVVAAHGTLRPGYGFLRFTFSRILPSMMSDFARCRQPEMLAVICRRRQRAARAARRCGDWRGIGYGAVIGDDYCGRAVVRFATFSLRCHYGCSDADRRKHGDGVFSLHAGRMMARF